MCCVQCGLFPFQTKEGFVHSKALAVLLGRLHDCWNNLRPQMYLNFCKCGFKEKLFFRQVGAKQKKAGGRGDVLFLVVFYFSLTRSHPCCSCSDLCNPCILPIGQCDFPFPSSVISSLQRMPINEDYNNLKGSLLPPHFYGCPQS